MFRRARRGAIIGAILTTITGIWIVVLDDSPDALPPEDVTPVLGKAILFGASIGAVSGAIAGMGSGS